jgi:shikimate kinase
MLARPDLAEVYQRRLTAYEQVATLIVPTDRRHPEAVSQDIAARLIQVPVAERPGDPLR